MEDIMTNNEFSLLMDLILYMVRNGHIDELKTILEKYEKSDLLAKAVSGE